MRAVARTGPGIGASPLRQNLFGIPGAIIPTTQEQREDGDVVNGAAIAAVTAARATWFTGAVVPRGNVTRPTQQQQQQVAAVEVPVPETVAKPTLVVEKEQEKEIVEEPAPPGVATRRRNTALAIAAAEEEEKAKAKPREQRRKTRASAVEVKEVAEPVKPVAAVGQKKGGKGKKTVAAAVEVAAAPVEEAPAAAPAAAVEDSQQRKRTRSTAVTEEPAASQPTAAPAPSKRRASSRLQQTSKSAAPAAPTTTRTTTRAAPKKDEEPEVASPPAAPEAAAVAIAQPEAAPEAVPASPAVPAQLDFQTIMAAAVIVNDTTELAQVAVANDAIPSSPAVPVVEKETEEPAVEQAAEPEALMPPPPPPVLAPEAVPPPPPPAPLFSPPALMDRVISPPMVTPVTAPAPTPSHARTASVLGKRSLAGLTGRTPATKRGRLGTMLAVGAKPNVRSLPKAADISPRQHEIQDIGSPTKPTKPSPLYADDFALPANSPGRRGKKKGDAGKPPRGATAVTKRPKAVKKMDLSQRFHDRVTAVTAAVAARPTDSSAGESIGDAPSTGETDTDTAAAVAAVTKKARLVSKLKPLSPIQNSDDADSDAEDEAMLQAAANGDLSPGAGSFDEEDELDDAAANASVLETTPAAEDNEEGSEDEEDVIVQTTKPLPKTKGAGKAGGGGATTTAPKTKKTATKRASRSVWTKSKKKRKTTKPPAINYHNRLSRLAALHEKAAGIEGVPSVGDDIKCVMTFPPYSRYSGEIATIHCQMTHLIAIKKDRVGGWVCTVEAEPVDTLDSSSQQHRLAKSVMAFELELHSAKLCAWDAELHDGEWAHMQALDASPLGAAGAAGNRIAPAETARHNAAARHQERDSLDSVPVLPSTAERLRSKAQAATEFVSPRMMRPVHLDMDKAPTGGGGGAGGGVQTTLPAAMAAVVTSAMKAARRDSLSSGGSYGLRQGMVSPAAHAAAMGMLGALYLGGTPQPPQNVEEHLQAVLSPQWASPHAAMA
jgi:hypothetical protein